MVVYSFHSYLVASSLFSPFFFFSFFLLHLTFNVFLVCGGREQGKEEGKEEGREDASSPAVYQQTPTVNNPNGSTFSVLCLTLLFLPHPGPILSCW